MPDFRLDAFHAAEQSIRMASKKAQQPLTQDSLSDVPLSYATCSIGCSEEHTLPKKLDAISSAGFQAIELSMPDIVDFANHRLREQSGADTKTINDHDFDQLVATAKAIKEICDAKGLKVLMLQPFANFEGWPQGSPERKDAWVRAEGWRRVMEAAGTDMLQVGSTDSPEESIGRDRNRFVEDLRELADFLAEKKFRICFENWCWSTHAPDWEDVWDICQRVDRPNFGLCLDTFQSAGGEYGDPTTASGLIEDGRSREKVTADWKKSCQRLSNIVAAEKIFVLQISDAYRPTPTLPNLVDHKMGLRPRAVWSHDFRPLPFDGYLPVTDFARAVLKTGFRGWFSYEIFDSGPDGSGKTYNLETFAQAAYKRQAALLEASVDGH